MSPEYTGKQAQTVFGNVDSKETLIEELFSGFKIFVLERSKQFDKEPLIKRYDPDLPLNELERDINKIVNLLVDDYIHNDIKERLLRKDN
ncbi:MAG: hypothetical protein IJU79_03020 [Desulfovibrionaceae bacterium]|nr:hypothetical protein [Desulfovibrionaceae bacterium]